MPTGVSSHLVDEWSPKGRIDVGDRVHLAHMADDTRASLKDLEGSIVLSVSGNTLELLPPTGSSEVEVDRRYFCLAPYFGHVDNPCRVCGYEDY